MTLLEEVEINGWAGKVSQFLELYHSFRANFSIDYELVDLTDEPWSHCDAEVCWWDSMELYKEDPEEATYSGEIRRSGCICVHDDYTVITHDDGCGNTLSGIFDNSKKVENYY